MRQRHSFGPARSAAGVKNQRDVIVTWEVARALRPDAAGSLKLNLSIGIELCFDHRDTFSGGSSRFFSSIGRDNQGARAGVVKIKLELISGVCRIQRSCSPGSRG